MSDNEPQTEQPEIADQREQEQAAPQQESQPSDTPSKREAKYRTELRASQARNDALERQLAALQRAEVHRLASSRLHDPTDALRDIDLAEMLGDDGTVSEERVNAVIDGVAEVRPHHVRPPAPSAGIPTAVPAAAFTATQGVNVGSIGGLGGEHLSINRQQQENTEDWTTVLRQAAGG